MSEAVRGVVVAHARLAEALIGAVAEIAGADEGALVALSNQGLAPPAIRERLESLVGPGPTIVFTDLREGSCGLVGRQVCTDRPGRALVTGVNLPMLLDFVLNRDRPLEELVARVIERGQSAVRRQPGRG
ncbi:MAG: PTS sugar transporter subunit IIA [Gemmatimonadota bacterium]